MRPFSLYRMAPHRMAPHRVAPHRVAPRVVALCALLSAGAARAQIRTDGTLGPALLLPGPNYQIPSTLGRTLGHNLFHSFGDFNLASGQSANFSGPPSILNILSRVTGSNPSLLDGSLNSSIRGANFFFLNPHGIVFGPNAQINVGGSFVASTADLVQLQDGGVFHASNPSASVLSSAPPTAFGFLNPAPAPIILDRAQLSVAAGRALSLVGGDLVMRGTAEAPSIVGAAGGKVNLVSVASAGKVVLNAADATSQPALQGFAKMGAIDLNAAIVNVADGPGARGGSVTVRGDSLRMDGAVIFDRNNGATTGGAIDIGLSGQLQFKNGAGVRSSAVGSGAGADIKVRAANVNLESGSALRATSEAGGKGGDISVSTGNLQVSNGAQINTFTTGSGAGGDIILNADSVRLDSLGQQQSPTGIIAQTGGAGKGGAIRVTGDQLQIVNGASIFSSTSGIGEGGKIVLHSNDITIDSRSNPSFTGVSTQTGSAGKGGAIEIETKQVRINNGGLISSTALNAGAGGNIGVRADSIQINGQKNPALTGIATATSLESGGGRGGAIDIAAKNLQIVSGGSIGSFTLGSGAGGNVSVQADTLALDGQGSDQTTGIVAKTQAANKGGRGGALAVSAQTLHIFNDAQIVANTSGDGTGGNITIQADTILLDAQGIRTLGGIETDTTATGNGGKAGDVTLNAQKLQILNGGSISADTFGSGAGGRIGIRANDIQINGGKAAFFTGISAQTAAKTNGGQSGDIAIEARNLVIVSGGAISASTFGSSDGGAIIINADAITLDRRGHPLVTGIDAQTKSALNGGKGGDIAIVAKKLLILNGGSIGAATFGNGAGGNVSVKADDITLDRHSFSSPTGISAQTNDTLNGGKGGVVSIETKKLAIHNGAVISASTFGSGAGGGIVVKADDITLDGADSSLSANSIAAGQGGAGGNINVIAKTLHISGGALISADSQGAGNGGNVSVKANDLTIDGQNQLFITGIIARTNDVLNGGKGGAISIEAKKFALLDGGQISASTFGSGAGGGVVVKADDITLDGDGSSLKANSNAAGQSGAGGNINVIAKTLTILRGAEIGANTFGSGNGGSVSIKTNALTLDGQGSDKPTSIGAQTSGALNGGKGGDISIAAKNFIMRGGGQISANTFGSGAGGSIAVKADNITLDRHDSSFGTGIGAQSSALINGGKGGDINVEAQNLTILRGAEIGASTFGSGAGGSVSIKANALTLNGQGSDKPTSINAATLATANGGAGGDISIDAKTLQIRNDAFIAANSRGNGTGGDIKIATDQLTLTTRGAINARSTSASGGGRGGSIDIRATDAVRISEQGSVTAQAKSADGGNISISTGDSLNLDKAQVTTEAGQNGGNIQLHAGRLIQLRNSALKAIAQGTGGNITIDTGVGGDSGFAVFDRSFIQADAINGNGGNISIQSRVFLPSIESRITASSQFGVAGDIVTAPNPNLGSSLVVLATNPLSAENDLIERCLTRRGAASSFIVGRQGLVAPDPFGFSPSYGLQYQVPR